MTHEVYLATDILELSINGRYHWLVDEIHSKAGIRVGYSGKHMTIAFCNEMPMEKLEQITSAISKDLPQVPLEFTKLQIIGQKNDLVLSAERVPQEWLDYVLGIKRQLVEEFGCKVDRVESFLPHITLKYHVENANIESILTDISSRMRPICVKKATPVWIDRTDNHKKL